MGGTNAAPLPQTNERYYGLPNHHQLPALRSHATIELRRAKIFKFRSGALTTLRGLCVLRRGQGLRPFPRAPCSARGILPSLRFGRFLLDEAEHFLEQSSCQRRFAPRVFGFIPECRSDSPRIQRSASPESPVNAYEGVGCHNWPPASTIGRVQLER